MDKYDYHEIDKAVSKKLEAIFSNPKRHKFTTEGHFTGSCTREENSHLCFHCGKEKLGHAERTERL